MIKETLKSIKENRYSYSSPTVEDVAQKMLDLKEENAQLKELNREMVTTLKFAYDNLTFLITDSSEFDFIEVRKAIKGVLAKAEGVQ